MAMSIRSVRELMRKIDKQGMFIIGDAKFPVTVHDIFVDKRSNIMVVKPVGGTGSTVVDEMEVEID